MKLQTLNSKLFHHVYTTKLYTVHNSMHHNNDLLGFMGKYPETYREIMAF